MSDFEHIRAVLASEIECEIFEKHVQPALEVARAAQEQRAPVTVVVARPGYWSGGHYYEGGEPWINAHPTVLPIGTPLYPGATPVQAEAPSRKSKCAQCSKEYRPGRTTMGCPKCAPGLTISEADFLLLARDCSAQGGGSAASS